MKAEGWGALTGIPWASQRPLNSGWLLAVLNPPDAARRPRLNCGQ